MHFPENQPKESSMKNKIEMKFAALLMLQVAVVVGLLGCQAKPEKADEPSAQHIGSFHNGTGVQATDLDIEFDVEGVEYDGAKKNPMDKWEYDKDNKKIVKLDGNVNIGNSAFGQKFKRKDGEFKIVSWWWTQIDPETKAHKQLGGKHDGPPTGEDGEWK